MAAGETRFTIPDDAGFTHFYVSPRPVNEEAQFRTKGCGCFCYSLVWTPGSVMSLMAGLVFGGLSAFGAYNITNDPKDIKVSLLSSGVLAVIMGMRYKNSGKLMPAGIMTGLSLLMVFRLLLLIV
uniref:Transmembrane protein 14A n=1 Tax=Oreochromis niloticus TaxID=8128 RepID=A0A669BNN7_ORENI